MLAFQIPTTCCIALYAHGINLLEIEQSVPACSQSGMLRRGLAGIRGPQNIKTNSRVLAKTRKTQYYNTQVS